MISSKRLSGLLLFCLLSGLSSCFFSEKGNPPSAPEKRKEKKPDNFSRHKLPQAASLKKEKNGVVLPASLIFQAELFDHPELVLLRKREGLNLVVSDGKTEFEKMLLLLDWVNSQWRNSIPRPYPPWNANRILEMIRSGETGGFCAQYAVVFGQACLSLGWPIRYIELQPKSRGPGEGHFSVEVWSNQFNKWIFMDPFFDCYFERESLPLSALEIHKALLQGEEEEIKMVRGRGKHGRENSPLSKHSILRKFYYLAVDMRNNHLSNPHGFWDRMDTYLAWREPGQGSVPPVYSWSTSSEVEFNFPYNQLEVSLLPGPLPGTIACRLRSNMPGLAAVEIKKDQDPWETFFSSLESPESKPSLPFVLTPDHGAVLLYRWKLHPGRNHISFRPVNKLGRRGPESEFIISFNP